MQVRQGSFQGDRPPCPVDPLHPIHIHGSYERYVGADGTDKEPIPRFLCDRCGHTISVLPDNKLPYWSVPVPDVQVAFDRWSGLVPDSPGPPWSENKKARLIRARERLIKRAPILRRLLGQMVPRDANADVLWTRLRRLKGTLGHILRFLASTFKSSLLGDYRCLRPWFDSS